MGRIAKVGRVVCGIGFFGLLSVAIYNIAQGTPDIDYLKMWLVLVLLAAGAGFWKQ